MSIILAAFYLFNPAILVNSSVWWQVDSFFTLILVLAVYMLSDGRVGIAPISIIISALNILLFVYCTKVLIDISRNRGGVKID